MTKSTVSLSLIPAMKDINTTSSVQSTAFDDKFLFSLRTESKTVPKEEKLTDLLVLFVWLGWGGLCLYISIAISL